MDARIKSLTDAFTAYTTQVAAYVEAAEKLKTDIATAVAEAVAKDDADEDVDFAELQQKITEAATKVPPPPTPPAGTEPAPQG